MTTEEIEAQIAALQNGDESAEITRLEKVAESLRKEHRQIDNALKPLIVDSEGLPQDLRLRYSRLWNAGDAVDAIMGACADRLSRVTTQLSAARSALETKRSALLRAKRELEASQAAHAAQEAADVERLRYLLGVAGVRVK